MIDINQSAPTQFPKASFSSLHRSFRGRADYLLVPAQMREYKDASTLRRCALIGFEFKKALEEEHLAQARLGHLLYGSRSNTAYLYVSGLIHGWWYCNKNVNSILLMSSHSISTLYELLPFMHAWQRAGAKVLHIRSLNPALQVAQRCCVVQQPAPCDCTAMPCLESKPCARIDSKQAVSRTLHEPVYEARKCCLYHSLDCIYW